MGDFSGTWETDFGTLELEVEGNCISGEFGTDGGELEGIVGGNRAAGKWNQRSAAGRGISWGSFSLSLCPDGQSFQGNWSYGDELAPEGGTWKGKRVKMDT